MTHQVILFPFIGLCNGVDDAEPDTGPVFMLEPPSNLLVYSHVGVAIPCIAHGKPTPEISWERANGSSLPRHTSKYTKGKQFPPLYS